MRVANQKIINHLSLNSLKAAKSRNLIAIAAVVLTTMLFTTLFTVALSINHSFQEANFRQVGGWPHGTFKYLTEEQFAELKDDPQIKAYGLRRFVGMPNAEPFHKAHVEVSYSDANNAHWMYCDPVEGRLPAEGTNEAATDTRVLSLLGVEPQLGNEFTMSFNVDGQEVKETFVLSGWWEYDEAIVASHVQIPMSRAEEIFVQTGLGDGIGQDGMTGSWGMDIMLNSTLHIEEDMQHILAKHGYQNENRQEEGYIATGVNWGYSGAQLANNVTPGTVLAIIGLLLLIGFTGYLIIYNVFQISVVADIRFYGLLKTIGATGRQLKTVIRNQAFILALLGIPLGLLSGYLVGVGLTPVILARLNGVVQDAISVSPNIFISSAAFSLLTVIISCRKPGRMAARVSPVEAVRYTEVVNSKKVARKTKRGGSVFKMALANLGRNRNRTIITVLSLSLAAVLLNLTVTFTGGFDMDKYLSNVVSDFIVADAGYFQVGSFWSGDIALPEEVIALVETQSGIEAGGRAYGMTSIVEEAVTEEYYRSFYGRWNSGEQLEAAVNFAERYEDGRLADHAQLYGMEPYLLDKLQILEGDLAPLYEPGGKYVAAVYFTDDYGEPQMNSHWAKVGDMVNLRYVEEYEYFDPQTGEILDPEHIPDAQAYRYRAKIYRDETYEVVALVHLPNSLTYRYYGSDEFILNDQTFIQDSGTNKIMYYSCDVTDEAEEDMEAFMAALTSEQLTQLDYESRKTYQEEFESFRSMFLLLGGVLSFIVGLVGVLNFFNAILTGIMARRREFAILQSIGMTGRQLKAMLIWEGLFYAFSALVLTLILTVLFGPILATILESMFWFFTYRFIIWPVLVITPLFILLGICLPPAIYGVVSRQSIVERLQNIE